MGPIELELALGICVRQLRKFRRTVAPRSVDSPDQAWKNLHGPPVNLAVPAAPVHFPARAALAFRRSGYPLDDLCVNAPLVPRCVTGASSRVIIRSVASRIDRFGVSVFLFFTFGLSSIFYFLIIRSGHVGGGGGSYAAGLMWCPGAAALLACKYLRRDIGSLGWKWGKTRYQAASYLIPLGYAIVTYSFVWLMGFGGVPNKDFVDGATKDFGLGAMPAWASIALSFLFTATTGVISDCATTMGEEIGWRGFLVPELAKRHSFAGTAIISGLVWAVWHFPILLFADYHAPTPTRYYLPIFILTLPAISFVLTWMRLRSGSLWTGVILHASHNTFMQTFFQPLTIDNSRTRYVAGEFGVALLVIAVLLAAYFWKRRGELKRTDADNARQATA